MASSPSALAAVAAALAGDSAPLLAPARLFAAAEDGAALALSTTRGGSTGSVLVLEEGAAAVP
jgi:hypothetical protein